MRELALVRAGLSETEFAAFVDEVKADPARRPALIALLDESNAVYDQRATAATVRMRGWVLLAFERLGLPREALLYVLEELDNGRDAYVVAAAARVLRSSGAGNPALAGYLLRALVNIRGHDDLVCFDSYGAYALGTGGTTVVREVLATLEWLGPLAGEALPELESMRANKDGQFSRAALVELDRTIRAIRVTAPLEECCLPLGNFGQFRFWNGTRGAGKVDSVLFEDHEGATVSFREMFHGRPSVVVFFYSRCDNPRKCSLTIAKLARVQQLLAERGLEERIRTAAISYDPEYDVPDRLRGYGLSRRTRLDRNHRILRSTTGMPALRSHFHLGVNFIESLVNRHRVEVFLLDANGKVAASFERIQWDEAEVVEQAARLLSVPSGQKRGGVLREALAPALALVTAIFPKCPMCWAAYLSLFGVAGLQGIPYSPWLVPVFAALMVMNLGSLWWRGRVRRSMSGFYLAAVGTFVLLVAGVSGQVPFAAPAGMLLVLAGAVRNAVPSSG